MSIASGFYILSAAGWVLAGYMAATGMFRGMGVAGDEADAFWRSLSVLDHAVRDLQVVTISAASVLLMLRRRVATRLILMCLAISFIATVAFPKWTVTFIGGAGPLLLLGMLLAFAYGLGRSGFLR